MQLTGEQINEFLSKAVLDSQIGEAVKKAVARVVEDLSKTWQNPMDSVIKNHVTQLIDDEVKAQYVPILKAEIQKRLAETMTNDLMEKFVTAGLERIKARY